MKDFRKLLVDAAIESITLEFAEKVAIARHVERRDRNAIMCVYIDRKMCAQVEYVVNSYESPHWTIYSEDLSQACECDLCNEWDNNEALRKLWGNDFEAYITDAVTNGEEGYQMQHWLQESCSDYFDDDYINSEEGEFELLHRSTRPILIVASLINRCDNYPSEIIDDFISVWGWSTPQAEERNTGNDGVFTIACDESEGEKLCVVRGKAVVTPYDV